jgi:uncharacterized protein YndB with AHSA1/START domain
VPSARSGEVCQHVNAPPEIVWRLLAHLDRMGEWSPECYQVSWLDGARSPAKVGARFKGRNRWGPVRWSMLCEVKVADPGREIAWSTVQHGRELVRWRYRLEPADGGTDLVESFQVLRLPPMARLFEDVIMVNRDHARERAMRATLERIKRTAEAASSQ